MTRNCAVTIARRMLSGSVNHLACLFQTPGKLSWISLQLHSRDSDEWEKILISKNQDESMQII
jgi:hypothetical protein